MVPSSTGDLAPPFFEDVRARLRERQPRLSICVSLRRPLSGAAPLSVSFDGTGSTTSSTIVEYLWDLGDGTIETGATLTYQYPFAENYSVTLSVVDDIDALADSVLDLVVHRSRASALPVSNDERKVS